MKWFSWLLLTIVTLLLLLSAGLYFSLKASLPELDGEILTQEISNDATLSRDALGTAIINASNEYDMAYLLGYAHAQDRLFQMDLLRRQSAGELSALVGKRALSVDKKHRFHQFRKRAESVFAQLSEHEKELLKKYTAGVNAGHDSLSIKPYEYFLVGGEFASWTPVDSLLATYSMYIDLQLTQTEIDFSLTAVKSLFGDAMHDFFTLPSTYQAAIDYSIVPMQRPEIPELPKQNQDLVANKLIDFNSLHEPPDIGSNNWAVSNKLTQSNSAMLSNDMHLGLNVPAIWYRAQLNYQSNNDNIQVTGVSLPGSPAIIVGSNGHIAWGFTNSNVDNVDWVELSPDTKTEIIVDEIITSSSIEEFELEMSQYGPVRKFNGKKYALVWVAHQDYAVNMMFADMAKMKNVQEALLLSTKVRIPVQNMVVADKQGQIAWQLTGAISARTNLKRHAIKESELSPLWQQSEFNPANSVNPQNGRVWSANARVVGTEDLERFGNGGYALGARQKQIVNLLNQQSTFTEDDFYNIQLNNQATFLMPWHSLLRRTLSNSPQKFAEDLLFLDDWQACACKDSVGYTLVRRFRSTVINQLIAPIEASLQQHSINARYLLRGVEPAIWEIINRKPKDWLPSQHEDYVMFLTHAYETTKKQLLSQHSQHNSMEDLSWGRVNTLRVNHPFAGSLGPLANTVNMSEVPGFGDSYMPAVQSGSFGASQRLIVRPGEQNKAILTIPGGQSGHFMSPFYKTGFDEYAQQASTPLLPGQVQHTLEFIAAKQ